ncbi:MAG TPA: DUF4915 domain-containing protein [Dongiaceae bacterium]|nr:DUF4915 domain-containing protein [Dongiaceae bacterium]
MLIASTFADETGGSGAGGMFAVGGSRAERIDKLSSVGLAYDGRRLARIVRAKSDDVLGELVIYDERGVQRYLRLDGVQAVHDVAWDGQDIVVVSAWHNAVRWFTPAGDVVREVRYAGPNDNWHVNCITRRDGEWYATMFGPVGPLGRSSAARNEAGRLVRLTTGDEVVGGLTAPHTPRWLDGLWLVCNSGRGELLAVDEAGARVARRADCGDWTRGLAWDDRFMYVGTSRRRTALEPFARAEVVVLDRDSWAIVERIALPAQELYDLALVTPQLLDGLRRGFDVNPLRAAEFRQQRLISELGVDEPRTLWPSGDPLPWNDFRCAIACTVPPVCAGATILDVPVRLTNRSASFFTSAPPAPVFVSYKWTDPASGALLAGGHAYRSPLPRTVYPGESIAMTARIVVPAVSGRAALRITAVQEGVAWFDDQHPANALDFTVDVTPVQPTVWEPTVWEQAAP